MLGAGGGAVAGFVTAMIHRKLKVHALLAGILVMTMIYSINLRIMGGPNLPVPRVQSQETVISFEEMSGGTLLDDLFSENDVKPVKKEAVRVVTFKNIFNNRLDGTDLLLIASICGSLVILMAIFLRTDMGMMFRGFGSNPKGIEAFGVSQTFFSVLGLSLANFLVGLSGGMFALYSGFADASMGQGMIVTGLAAVMLGEIVLKKVKTLYGLLAPIMGGILYQFLLSFAMKYGYRIGFMASDMKLLTALFIIVVIGFSMLTSKDGKKKLMSGVKRVWSN